MTAEQKNPSPDGFSDQLQRRLGDYASRIYRVADALPDTKLGRHVRDQLFRSGTAPGAHYAEARSAQSRGDFIYKLGLAAKEARESLHWLRVARGADLERDCSQLEREGDELVAVLFQSLKTARENRE